MAKTARVEFPRAALERGELPPVCLLTGAREGVRVEEVDLPVRPVYLALAEAAGLAAAYGLGQAAARAAGLSPESASGAGWLLASVAAAADRFFLEGRWPRPWRVRLPVVPETLAQWRARQALARIGQAAVLLVCGLAVGVGPAVLSAGGDVAMAGGLIPLAALGAAVWLQRRAGTPRLALVALSPEKAALRLSPEAAAALGPTPGSL